MIPAFSKEEKISCNPASQAFGSLDEVTSRSQFLKFLLVGISNTVLGYIIFLLFLAFTDYVISLVFAHIIGVVNSFIWNKYWTFKSNGSTIHEFIKFNLIYVLYFILNITLLVYFVSNLNISPEVGQLIALPILTIISFLGQKHWSFGKVYR